MTAKTHSWPENHWNWPVTVSHYHGVRRGGFIFTGGQADLDKHGSVINPDSLEQQTFNVVEHVGAILADLDASLDDIVKLVIYFTGDAADEQNILQWITAHLSPETHPVVSTVCLPALCYPGMRIELEAVAIDPALRSAHNPEFRRSDTLSALHPRFSHAARCNNLIFTGDVSAIDNTNTIQADGNLEEQTQLMMEQLNRTLALFGASTTDALKLNVFYLGDGTADNWEKPAAIRAAFFNDPGPAATGIAVNRFARSGLMTKIAVTAVDKRKDDTSTQAPISYSWPAGHWNWTTALPYKHGNRAGHVIHLGGQVALDADANVLHPNNIVEQTKVALANISVVLAELGAEMNDIVKVTTFYKGDASADELHKNLSIRSAAFSTPGPATSGIPVPYLVYQNMVIEIEVIAIVDSQ